MIHSINYFLHISFSRLLLSARHECGGTELINYLFIHNYVFIYGLNNLFIYVNIYLMISFLVIWPSIKKRVLVLWNLRTWPTEPHPLPWRFPRRTWLPHHIRAYVYGRDFHHATWSHACLINMQMTHVAWGRSALYKALSRFLSAPVRSKDSARLQSNYYYRQVRHI